MQKPTIKLTTYNVLAQCYVGTDRYTYVENYETVMDWPWRWNMLQKQFLSFDSDILCCELEDLC